MPLYEYRCTACGYSFEKIQSFSAEPETVCPKCQGALVRPVTAPALRFAGAGWYVNDYAGKGGAKAGDAPAASADTSKDAAPAATSNTAPSASGGTSAPAPAPAAAPSSAPGTAASSS